MGRIALAVPPLNHYLHHEAKCGLDQWNLATPERRNSAKLVLAVARARAHIQEWYPTVKSMRVVAVTVDYRLTLQEVSLAKVSEVWDFGSVSDLATGV